MIEQSDTRFPHSHRLLNRKKLRDSKSSEIIKNDCSIADSNGENNSQFDQNLVWFLKKDFYFNERNYQGQSFNTLVTDNNATNIKKNKKQGNKELS